MSGMFTCVNHALLALLKAFNVSQQMRMPSVLSPAPPSASLTISQVTSVTLEYC